MNNYKELIEKQKKLAVVGLGYVGMPIAIEFAKHIDVIGFDINKEKIKEYKKGNDVTGEVGSQALATTSLLFTSDERDLDDSVNFFIVAVPTPINSDNSPDLRPVIGASEIVARHLKAGSIVVYESTVYPGVTEEVCIPILEKLSGMKFNKDFFVGYSPERINPGDKIHRLVNIKKIVSGSNPDVLNQVAAVYELVVEAGVHRASSIKVAEAAKVIENSQRDINIAFMNELSIIFNKMGIDTLEVLEAAGTKWNFLPFRPGLVGGHCIGIDPYYLTYKAEQYGYHSQVILSGRRINDDMGKYVAEQTVKQLIKADISIKNAKVGCLGITFKEDCPDVRNSKVNDILKELNEYGINPIVCDPIADISDAKKFYGVELVDITKFRDLDCLIIAVMHKEFKALTNKQIENMFNKKEHSKHIIIDVKGTKNKQELEDFGYRYWRL